MNPGRDVERLAAFARFNPNPVLEFAATGELGYCNEAAGEMARSLGRAHPSEILPPGTVEIVRECLATGKPRLRIEASHGGRIISWSFFPIQQNQVVHCYAGDITERKHADLELARIHRALKMLSNCSETLVRARNENELLHRVCQIAVEHGGYHMAWVGYAQEDADRSIRPMAHAGLENGYLSDITVSWDENQPSGRGPAGTAIRTGKISTCADIHEQAGAFIWVEAASLRGYKSVICLPLRYGQRTFGMLGLYSSEIHEAVPEERKLLQQLADDLAFGIAGIRARDEQSRTQEAVLAIARGVSTSAGVDFFLSLSRHLVQALHGDACIIATLNLPDTKTAHTVAMLVDGETQENFSYSLLGTPCEQCSNGSFCLIEQGVRQRFPDDRMLADLGVEAYVGTPLLNAQGAPIGLMTVLFRTPIVRMEFITSTLQIFAARAAAELERQRADMQVREQASLLDKAHDAILVCDLEHHVTYWNESAELLYGWTRDEVRKRTVSELLFKAPEVFQQARKQFLETGEWVGEQRHVNREGEELTIESRWTLVRDDAGRAHSILMINTDATQRKTLEAHLLRSQRMESIGTLAGGIAHDLNNVLAPILMAIQLLRDKTEDPESKGLLNTMQACSQRGADLVRQVLAFARGVEGERIALNPGHLVRDVQKIIHDTFPKNIEFAIKQHGKAWMVKGDPTQLHQVILNLCVNARDAMPGGGRLTVSTENIVLEEAYVRTHPGAKSGGFVLFKVTDTGTGIPLPIREKIFEPFFTTKEVGKGTGLGLSTTMAIVRSHNGFIQLDSEEGVGTTFSVYVPAETSPGLVLPPEKQKLALCRGNGQLILVVDDEDGIRSIAKSTLEWFGYRVILAANGAEALAIYGQQGADIAAVLTDMAMPVMDGPATIIALKALNPKVRIIGSSGLASQQSVALAVGSGVKHFIPKPYTADKMLEVIAQALLAEP